MLQKTDASENNSKSKSKNWLKTVEIGNNWFFIGLTLVLVLSIFLSKLVFATAIVKNNFIKKDFSSSILTILSSDPENLESEINSLESEIISNLKPLSAMLPVEGIIKEDVGNLIRILKKWLEAYKPLSNYTFTNKGLVNKLDSGKFFTDDLNDFFLKATSLLLETKKIWADISFYKFILSNFSGDKLKSYIENTDELINFFEKIIIDKDYLLNILGHFSNQKLVIFNQNSGEARPTGGFVGSYIPINISKGRLEIQQSQSIYYVDGSTKDLLYAHPVAWNYGYFENSFEDQGLRNLNYFPCFSTTAKTLEDEFSKSGNGYSIDTLLMINPQFLTNFLPANFNVKVDENLVLNSSNLSSEIERVTSTEAKNISNPKEELTKILNALINKLPEVLSKTSSKDLVEKLLQSIFSRDIQSWYKNPNIQAFVDKLGFSSEQACESPEINIVTPLIANISGDKRNLLTQNQFNLFKNNSTGEITLKYKQILPDNPVLQRGFSKDATFTFVGLQLPKKAQKINVQSPQDFKIPFLRKYYDQGVFDVSGKAMRAPESVQKIVDTGKNLYSEDGSKPGFVYQQPDGSQVVGIYIKDQEISEVTFSFILKDTKKLKFLGQPGLNEPVFSLGQNVEIENYPETQIITNQQLIQQGLNLKFD